MFCGEGAVARRRRTGVDVRVCVAVAVGVFVGWLREEGWWWGSGGGIVQRVLMALGRERLGLGEE